MNIKGLIPFSMLLFFVAVTILVYMYFALYEYKKYPLDNLDGFFGDAPHNYSRPLFFARVPKCGSENMVYVMKALQKHNKFIHNRLVQTKRRLTELQQEDIVAHVMHTVRSSSLPQSFDRHVFFINFSHYHAPFPIYMSLIRDPVEKMISRFFYKRGNVLNEYQRLKRRGLVNVSLADWLLWDAQLSPGDSDNNGTYSKPTRNAAFLQRRIEKRIEQARKSHSTSNGTVDQQPRKSLMSINRLNVPNKLNIPLRDGAEQPLVMWQSDSSEDEYEFLPAATYHSAKELSKQLHKDSFNPDLKPSDEDLDLIPPRAFNQNCICCQWSASTCSIQ